MMLLGLQHGRQYASMSMPSDGAVLVFYIGPSEKH
jgi:hypothetical protein